MKGSLKSFEFPAIPTDVVFGYGVLGTIGEKVRALGGSRVLVLTDAGVQKAGILSQLEELLQVEGIEFRSFSDVPQDSSTSAVQAALDMLRQAECDLVIGLGGGSAIDTAKAVAIAAGNNGELLRFVGLDLVEKRPLPVIAIPTTAGTGSEVSLWSVITDDATRQKVSIGGKVVFPRVALCDPQLTLSLPPSLTASTGMDALTHAIESYVNNRTQPISQALSLRAIELIGRHLRSATLNGRDHASRYWVMLGSTLAGMAMNPTRLGNAHALAIPLGSWEFKIPHGMANAILLPHVMEFNLGANIERFVDVARALGEDVVGINPRKAAERSVSSIRQLTADIGIPAGLGRFGLHADDVPRIVDEAMKSGNIPVNPRLTSADDLTRICLNAI